MRLPKFHWHALLSLTFLWLTAPAWSQEQVPDLEGQILQWTNQYRQMYGRPELTLDPKLTQAAKEYAAKMAQVDKAAYALDGKTADDRAKSAGYAFHALGENVAYATVPDNPGLRMFEAWMLSPPHWQKIHAKDCTEIGVAVFRSKSGNFYACQVFGARSPPKLPVTPTALAPYQGQPGAGAGFPQAGYYPTAPPTKEGLNLGFGSLPVTPALPENYYTPTFTPYYGH